MASVVQRHCLVASCPCKVLAPYGLCDSHRAQWLLSPEHLRRSRMRQLGYGVAAIQAAFVDFVSRRGAEDREDRAQAALALVPPPAASKVPVKH